MPNVVFVAPFFFETTLGFVDAVSRLPGVRLALVSQEALDRLEPGLRGRLVAHVQVERALDPRLLRGAVEEAGRDLGSIDRLLGTLEELQVPLGEIRDRLGLQGMGAEAARNFRDKAQMKRALAAHGLPCARHRLVRSSPDALDAARDIGFPLVVKPPEGAGARSTFRINDESALIECLRGMAPSPELPLLLEEFLVGREHSFDSVCVGGELVWSSINHYFPTPLEVLREAWIQWCVVLPREVDRPGYDLIRAAAARALPALGMRTGLSHMEWFEREDGSIAISEVGARPPGAQFTKLISAAHDFDLNRAWADLVVNDRFEPRPRPYAAGAVYLKGQGRGSVREIHGLDQAQRELGPLVFAARLPELGQTPSGSYEGEGFVILRHPETTVVENGLRRVLELVRVELG